MPQGYSRDLRERLLHAVASGVSMVEIERTTDVSVRSLIRWKNTQDGDGTLEPGQSPGRPRLIDEEIVGYYRHCGYPLA